MIKRRAIEGLCELDPEEAALEVFLAFVDRAETNEFASFLRHIGFDFERVPRNADSNVLYQCFRAHFLVDGVPDIRWLRENLATWPPIAKNMMRSEQQRRARSARHTVAALG